MSVYARELQRKTLFLNQAGPQIHYTEDGMATLNPECEIEWRLLRAVMPIHIEANIGERKYRVLSRLEMFRLGLHCIMAAFWMR
jgi:hypothetical protein